MGTKLAGDKYLVRDHNELVRNVERLSRVNVKGAKGALTPGGLAISVPKPVRGFVEPAIVASAWNASGGLLKMWQPVAITGQTGDSGKFKRVLSVNVPTADDVGRWAICAEPIREDGVGRVYVSGMCLAMLENPDSLDKCEIEDGGDTLVGDADGSAQIFWEDTAVDPEDPHLALIRFPCGLASAVIQMSDIASTANRSSLSGSSGSIDGITIAGKIILLKNQTTASENGRYQVPPSGSGSWSKLDQPDVCEIRTGTLNARTRWILTSANTYSGGLDFFS